MLPTIAPVAYTTTAFAPAKAWAMTRRQRLLSVINLIAHRAFLPLQVWLMNVEWGFSPIPLPKRELPEYFFTLP